MAALSTTSWLISGKVSPSERPGPGAIRKASLLMKCIGMPAPLVRTRDGGLYLQFVAPLLSHTAASHSLAAFDYLFIHLLCFTS